MIRQQYLYLGLPPHTVTFDLGKIPKDAFQRFFDSLSPTFGHMISLGQSNTIVSCPALTTHSELSESSLLAAGLTPTTVRCAVGDESPMDLIRHLVYAARGTIDKVLPGFTEQFLDEGQTREMIERTYVEAHAAHIKAQLGRVS